MNNAKFFEKFKLFAEAKEASKSFREVVLNVAFSGKLKGTNLNGWETHPIGDFFTEDLRSVNAHESPDQTFELWSVPSFETGSPEIVTGAQVGSAKRELVDGTILLGKINPHLNRIWVVKRRTEHPMIASQEWINITAGDEWDTDYLARLLSSPSFNRSVCATAQGMGSLTRANTKQVAKILVHRPPIQEQRKLVKKVDELIQLCDRLESQLKLAESMEADLAKAALADLLETPSERTLENVFSKLFDTPIEDLGSAVRSLCVKGHLTKSDKAEWPLVELGKIGEWGSGGTPLSSQNSYYKDGTIPWLVIGDLNDGLVTKAKTFITQEGLDNSSARLLPKGVLLIAMYGSIGKMGITGIECATNQAIAFCKPDPSKVNIRYLFHALKSIQPDLLGRGQGLAQKNISQTILKAWKIPLPSLTEQEAIVIAADSLLHSCEKLGLLYLNKRDLEEKLLEAMVAELTAA